MKRRYDKTSRHMTYEAYLATDIREAEEAHRYQRKSHFSVLQYRKSAVHPFLARSVPFPSLFYGKRLSLLSWGLCGVCLSLVTYASLCSICDAVILTWPQYVCALSLENGGVAKLVYRAGLSSRRSLVQARPLPIFFSSFRASTDRCNDEVSLPGAEDFSIFASLSCDALLKLPLS